MGTFMISDSLSALTEKLKMASGTVDSFIYTGDGDEVVVPLDIAIAAMGDAAIRKDAEGLGKTEAESTQPDTASPTNQTLIEEMEKFYQDFRNTLRNKTTIGGPDFSAMIDCQNRLY